MNTLYLVAPDGRSKCGPIRARKILKVPERLKVPECVISNLVMAHLHSSPDLLREVQGPRAYILRISADIIPTHRYTDEVQLGWGKKRISVGIVSRNCFPDH